MIRLIIDCGTTNLRVTAIDAAQNVLGTVRAEGGVRHTAIDGNNERLQTMLRGSIDAVLSQSGYTADQVERCVAYGMITSNMGLLEIPHVCAPASVQDLRAAMQERIFEAVAPFPIAFIPGVRNFSGTVDMDNYAGMDMMRGEETEAIGLYQLLALHEEALFILPGSHNKFVHMGEEGEILGCMTSISGELLDAVTHHTILADAVNREFVSEKAYDAEMACEGALACMSSGLGRAAFSGRILSTLGGRDASAVQSYLLGAVLALDVQALTAFLPSTADETLSDNVLNPMMNAALGVAPNVPAQVNPKIFVAGKAPIQQAMCDVLAALDYEHVRPVPVELSQKMGLYGALHIGF